MSRTLKNVEFIILDIVDSVTSSAAAVVSLGSCDVGSVRTGEARHSYHRTMGSVLLKCPVAAAKWVIAECRILINWILARVGTLFLCNVHRKCA